MLGKTLSNKQQTTPDHTQNGKASYLLSSLFGFKAQKLA